MTEYAVVSRKIKAGPLKLNCHVLSDGTKVVEDTSVEKFNQWLSTNPDPNDVMKAQKAIKDWIEGN